MFGTMGAVAAPEGCRKRPFQDDETYSMANGLPPKRLCEGFGVLSYGQDSTAGDDIGADLTTTNTQPGASGGLATDNQSYFQISNERQQHSEPQERRGRTRWREGSEPLGWDDSEWTTPRNMVASFDDGPGAQQNPILDSDAGTIKADCERHRA
ncbi:uncharacterized protein TRIREDRAFT_104313 [Trichoderma reesei QM6a]|uniref:Predicted protein n=2 Tax=Hypocrea jecorina TaxID=51453 RepID=G0RC19_HYPJQ|nr:uncharacterized protein TRIREDRAFT_104313 [Trichoderma reesei QM6a]EGR51429.1 predicted protein [Trichoderma reesei QM6a]ETS04618.1 hypothetical protein M419DRAFT_73165 [Trichoderma reesei RUT C-30]